MPLLSSLLVSQVPPTLTCLSLRFSSALRLSLQVAKMKMGRRALLEPSQVQDPFGNKNPSSAPNAEVGEAEVR